MRLLKWSGIFLYLVLCFFIVVAFNPKSAEMILEGLGVGSEFYDKSRNAFFFLMLLLIINPLQLFILYGFLVDGKIERAKKLVLYCLVLGVCVSLIGYLAAGVVPFNFPVAR